VSRQAPATVRRMQGLTLVELLVALTLGLLLVVATVAGYLGLSDAARMAEAQSRMDENGQAALAVLSANLRMAGNNPEQPYRVPATRRNPVYATASSYVVRGCDGKFTNIATAASAQDLNCASSSASDPDSIAITYEADRYNTVTLPPDWKATDCLGKELATLAATMTVITPPGPATETAIVNYQVAENRFYIDSSGPASHPSLYCKGNGVGSAPGPLVENVEDLQLTYGAVPAGVPTNSANVAGYLDAAGVAGHVDLASLPDDAARWGKVASVRVCVVVRSDKPLVGSTGSARYVNCDGAIESSPPDLHLRRAYSTTVVLRNRR
jgi:type IV pilus assembly protein PilW